MEERHYIWLLQKVVKKPGKLLSFVNLNKFFTGHLDCVKFLLEICKVNPDPQDRWNQTPLSEAMRHRQYKAVKYIKEFIDNNPDAGNEVDPYRVHEEPGVIAL